MRIFSYQNKRRLKVAVLSTAAIVLVLIVFCLVRFIFVQRYLVYTDGGVMLNYDQSLEKDKTHTQITWRPEDLELITDEPVVQTSGSADMPLQPISGSYITTQMLLDMEKVNAALGQLHEYPDAIMLDLKSIYGNFYYSSGTAGAVTSSADIEAVDHLIASLANRTDLYLIARIASLSDTNFGLANQSCGLPLRSGALWMSDAGCYWLDPMQEQVQDYLVSIARELALMGFDEVVFDDFRIPDSTNIIYRSELTRQEAAAEAAKAIREKLSDVGIRISFNSADPAVGVSSDRVYLVSQDGGQVAAMVESLEDVVTDTASEIVFLTSSRDTRFDGYSILRPLIEERQQ